MPYAPPDAPWVLPDDPDVSPDGWYDEEPGPPGPVPGFAVEFSARPATVRWELIDRQHEPVDELHPRSDDAPNFTTSVSGEASRLLRGLTLLPGEAAGVDPAQHRVRAMVPFAGEDWPFGVYRVSDADVVRFSGGDLTELTLPDESITLRTKINRSLGWARGRPVDLIAAELASYHRAIPFVEVDASTATLGEPLAFAFGSATWQEVAEAVAKAGGFLPPHFDNAGVWRWRIPPDYDLALAELIYEPDGGDIVFRSLSEGLAFLDSPNVWYARNTGATDAVLGRYELAPSAPNSIARLEEENPEVVDSAALYDQDAADDTARAAAAGSLDDVGKASLEAPFDPRHELYSHLRVGPFHYREVGTSGTVSAASIMGHDLRRVWRYDDPAGELLGGVL